MAIAGVLLIPVDREAEAVVVERLENIAGVDVQAIGPKGISVVVAADSTAKLKELSDVIKAWEEVADFQLTFLNWEAEL